MRIGILRAKTILFAVVAFFLFTSCNINHPKLYQTEIEDYVKFEVAICKVVLNQYENTFKNNLYLAGLGDYTSSYLWDAYIENIGNFEEAMQELWLNEDDEEGYRVILERVASTPNHKYQSIAKQVYDEYEEASIVISEFTRIPTSSNIEMWKFKELLTGLDFLFTIDGDTQELSCEVEETSLSNYLENQII